MSTEVWVDHDSHWIASGQVDSSGRMTDATVSDNVGTDRTRNASFSSRSDFRDWVVRTLDAQRSW
jgi:hypothetical protein